MNMWTYSTVVLTRHVKETVYSNWKRKPELTGNCFPAHSITQGSNKLINVCKYIITYKILKLYRKTFWNYHNSHIWSNTYIPSSVVVYASVSDGVNVIRDVYQSLIFTFHWMDLTSTFCWVFKYMYLYLCIERKIP